jgi:hypothetical protein
MARPPFELYEVYRGWTIYRYQYGASQMFYATNEALGIDSQVFYNIKDCYTWVDLQVGTGAPYDPEKTDVFSPDFNMWVGLLSPADRARENKLVALGPAPPGFAGKVEGLVLLVLIKKLLQTPEGVRTFGELAKAYLNNVGKIITGLSTSSAANVYNCLTNQYVAIRIYQRMGLVSAHDAVQTCAWVDHTMGNMIRMGYFKEGIGGLTTLVNASSETGLGGERSVGLASLARLLGGAGS